MISISEQAPNFSKINDAWQASIAEFRGLLEQNGIPTKRHTSEKIHSQGIRPGRIYFVESGSVSIEVDNKEICLLEDGDMIVPHSEAMFSLAEVYYTPKYEVAIESIDEAQLAEAFDKEPKVCQLWLNITSIHTLLLQQIVGSLSIKEERANPGFKRYSAGQEIIKEGDVADYVYSVNEGTAVAVHNGVEVGAIHENEIFGAIAVLTGQNRTASVVAKTQCTVLMVHKDEFTKMAQSHPKLFLNILKSLSNKIVALNSKVSEL